MEPDIEYLEVCLEYLEYLEYLEDYLKIWEHVWKHVWCYAAILYLIGAV